MISAQGVYHRLTILHHHVYRYISGVHVFKFQKVFDNKTTTQVLVQHSKSTTIHYLDVSGWFSDTICNGTGWPLHSSRPQDVL